MFIKLRIKMCLRIITLIVFCLAIAVKCESNDCFRAAVYEHFRAGNESELYSTIIDKNLNIYEDIAVLAAKEGVKILVFPEDGTIDPDLYSRSQLRHICEELPDPKTSQYISCDHSSDRTTRPTTYRLSCAAKKNGIYIVANFGEYRKCEHKSDPNCPDDGFYLFNTAVAFGSNGTLLAKYHKNHLVYEDYYNIPAEREFVYFDTPFGRIGLMICFDIVWSYPGIELIEKYGVNTIAFPTWWFDGANFITAENIQSSYAVSNKVNLLAADMHFLELASVGSGIYAGQSGAVIVSDVLGSRVDKLLIADIPINSRNPSAKCLTNRYNKTIVNTRSIDPTDYQVNFTFNRDGSKTVHLTKSSDSIRLCSEGFCCHLNYTTASGQDIANYVLFVANRTGVRSPDNRYPISEEICGVYRCDDQNCDQISKNSNQVFTHLEISAKFSTDYSYPMISTNHIQLVPKQYWNFHKTEQNFSLSLNAFSSPVVTLSLYGRCFDRDPPYKPYG